MDTLKHPHHSMLAKRVEAQFLAAIELKQQCLTSDFIGTLVAMAEQIALSLSKGGKLLLCGNGGSAADAQHLAAELLVRLQPHRNRQSIPAISLVMDPSTMTACANDYGFEDVFSRMVEALGKPGDVLLGITTSGRSPNVIKALESAKERKIVTLGFLGSGGGKAKDKCDLPLVVPSEDPGRIQEIHITAGHILMGLIEDILLQQEYLSLV
jgi:D-sedoheptulose 7-phosphate isomerase